MKKRNELRTLLTSAARVVKEVEVDGETYRIRSMTMREKGEIDLIPVIEKTGGVDLTKMARQRCETLCLAVVDDESNPVFNRSEWESWLDVPAQITSALLKAIDEINEPPSVDKIVKNSEPTGD